MSVTGPSTLCEAFQRTARSQPSAAALRSFGHARTLTWDEYRRRVESIARGLWAIGVRPYTTVGMMLSNRPEFHLIDLAAMHLGAVPFSVYNTLSAEQLEHVLGNSGARVLITEDQFRERLDAVRHRLPDLAHVITVGEELNALEAAGDTGLDYEACWRAVGPEQIATIIYTSGTTGPSKGALITHANLLTAWQCSVAAAPVLARRGRYLSYLPTAHLADRMFSHYPALMTGSEIVCADDLRAAVAGLSEIRPTLLIAVPRIWEKLKLAVQAGFPAHESLAGADLLVSGAAPLRPDVLTFFAGLGLEICEGYGMTESSGIAAINRPGSVRIGTVGPPMPGVELRLAEDGEILLRGAFVMPGYRQDPERTAEAIDADGWLRTGDIGRLDAHGHLMIVDRKKELIINAAGKNMSPANIEAQLKAASPLIAQAVAIGDARPYNTALLVLDRDMLTLRDLSPEHPAVTTEITAAVAAANTHLSRVEQIKRFTVLDHDWEPGGQQLTPTLKPRRRAIAERYGDLIEEMYSPTHT